MNRKLRLLTKFVPILLGIGIFSPAHAQEDVMKVILERLTASIKKLESSCGADIKKFCSTVTPGEGRVLLCLQAHEDQISAACDYEMSEVEEQFETTADTFREAVSACRGDIDKLCAKTQPGQGRIAACLAANRTSVSKSCVNAVQRLQSR